MVIGMCAVLMGTLLYHNFFAKYELRYLAIWTTLIVAVASAIQLCQAYRLNIKYWGISDFPLLAMIEIFEWGFFVAMQKVPCSVILQRMCPKNVEVSMMALSSTILNISGSLLCKLTGVWINY